MGVTRLRLARFGNKNRPFYRVVAVDSRVARQGQPLEYVGTYDPLPARRDGFKEVRLKVDRVKYWLSVGAQPSSTVAKVLWRAGLAPPPPITFQTEQHKPRKERKEAKEAAAKLKAAAAKAREEKAKAAKAAAAKAAAAAAGKKGLHTLAHPSSAAFAAVLASTARGFWGRPSLTLAAMTAVPTRR